MAKNAQGWGSDPRGHAGAPPTCHPDRPFHANDLCRQCYKAAYARTYRAAHPEKTTAMLAARRATSRRVGPGRVAVHGLSDTREYTSWKAMLRRVDDPTYKSFHRYGGRGITVSDRWRADFMAFYADMGPRPARMTIDRIDPDGNYEPGNCRWATQSVQVRNRSRH